MTDLLPEFSILERPTIVTAKDAATRLDELIDIAVAGETVLIGVSPNHFVKLTPIANQIEQR